MSNLTPVAPDSRIQIGKMPTYGTGTPLFDENREVIISDTPRFFTIDSLILLKDGKVHDALGGVRTLMGHGKVENGIWRFVDRGDERGEEVLNVVNQIERDVLATGEDHPGGAIDLILSCRKEEKGIGAGFRRLARSVLSTQEISYKPTQPYRTLAYPKTSDVHAIFSSLDDGHGNPIVVVTIDLDKNDFVGIDEMIAKVKARENTQLQNP